MNAGGDHMTLGEKLKIHRVNKGLSQEKVAELLGVSRQAVTKWENNQTSPSSDNLIALSSIYNISLDELANNKSKEKRKDNKILHSNLTLIAIILQTAKLNFCIQPMSTQEYGVSYGFLFCFKLIPLLLCSVWMAYNLRYEKNIVQYHKNVKIELLYCIIQAAVAICAFYSKLYFLGTLLLMAVCLGYIFIINPKYMNRTLVKRKTHD